MPTLPTKTMTPSKVEYQDFTGLMPAIAPAPDNPITSAGAVPILVNGREHSVSAERVGFLDVLGMAHPEATGGAERSFTVMYHGGEEPNAVGLLERHQTISSVPGLQFIAVIADAS